MSGPGGDIAVVGMACIYPKAPDLKTFWRNILAKVDAVTGATNSSHSPNVNRMHRTCFMMRHPPDGPGRGPGG